MLLKDKFLIVFLTIITLGLIWIYWSKLKNKTPNNELSSENKSSIKLSELFDSIGGKSNILKVENTHKKVKIFLNDISLVDKNKISKIKEISGLVLSNNSITLITGNNASYLKNEIEKLI
ncbi:hypothetical protein [[Mycoplasma] collis]|uniref:hypothetical protein n=1 Tax=[Mycoplasma] collis TaxID=2127 RepID=UPI00051B2F24|nr:hypothetical protein [[Mycoplasma] collis]